MANYTTITDVKLVLGKAALTSLETDRINLLLGVTKRVLDDIIGDLTENEKTEKIKFCDITKRGTFYINSYNITEIVKIDNNPYLGVENTDFYFDGREVYIGNLASFLDTKFDFFELTYKSGFAVIPKDLNYLQANMIAGEFNRENGQEIENYRIGDYSVSFSKESKSIISPVSIISKYKNFFV